MIHQSLLSHRFERIADWMQRQPVDPICFPTYSPTIFRAYLAWAYNPSLSLSDLAEAALENESLAKGVIENDDPVEVAQARVLTDMWLTGYILKDAGFKNAVIDKFILDVNSRKAVIPVEKGVMWLLIKSPGFELMDWLIDTLLPGITPQFLEQHRRDLSRTFFYHALSAHVGARR